MIKRRRLRQRLLRRLFDPTNALQVFFLNFFDDDSLTPHFQLLLTLPMEPQPFETETRYNKPLMLQMLAIVILLIFAMMDDIAWISGSSDAFNAELTMTSAEIKYSLPFPLFTETKTWSDHCIGLRRLFTGARFDTQPVGEQCWNFAETSTFISICAILAGVVLLISSLVVGLRGRLGHYQHFMRSVQVFLSLLSFSLAGFSVVILKTWLKNSCEVEDK